MNTTARVLYVRAAGAGDGGPGALEAEFDVVVAEGSLDAIKRLATGAEAPDCVVTPASPHDVALNTFLSRIARTAPDAATVVVGELSTDADDTAALIEADAYVPAGREAVLGDRIRRLLSERRIDRAIGGYGRLERTVKSIAVAVASATERRTVEEAVHDRLIEGDAYRHVWIAGRTDDGELTVRVPVTGRLGDEELADLVGGGDPAFVSTAVETGRVVATEGHVPTRSAASLVPPFAIGDRREARTLASAAVPFVHDGRVRGVGLVSTVRSDAFDGTERELLSDLGAVVGHALWALDSSAASGSEPGRGMENLVHDLRNPLGIARSHLEIAREDDDPESLERVESALERMVDTIDRVAEGVAGEPRVRASTDELAAAADRAWQSIEDASATLEVTDSASVRADRDLLVRMLSNLFRNAVDHGGGDVSVRVGMLEDGSGFFVEDDGPGIPRGERSSVFERGYSTSDDGLGIGLSIVRDVATAHGWSLTVTEAESGGARFEVTGVERVEGGESR